MKKKFIIGWLIFHCLNLSGQNVVISDVATATANGTAILDVQSTLKGMLVPRMTTQQREFISNAALGLLVFDLTTESFWFKATTGWVDLNNAFTVDNTLSGNGSTNSPLGLAPNGATNGQVLTWNGTQWIPKTPDTGVPAGTILAYGDANAPIGYLPCNGALYSAFTYPELYSAIGITWGGVVDISFNVPDLRGQFLRGYSGSSNEDPDKNSRFAKYTGGADGNNVGSYQSDELGTHNHSFNYLFNNSISGSAASSFRPDGSGAASTGNTGGNETRPKNANVFYIIKF